MQDLRQIAAEKLRGNRDARTALLALISKGEAVAFVGAGLSVPLKYPSWPTLLQTLDSEANTIAPFTCSGPAGGDALIYAEEIQEHFKNRGKLARFKSVVGREFAPKFNQNCTPTHRRVVKLPFKAFITTNYEVCVEQALTEHAIELNRTPLPNYCVIVKSNGQDRHLVSTFLRSLDEKQEASARYVAHIHGRYDDVENIVLTKSDYARAYGFAIENGTISNQPPASTLHRQLVWTLFASRRMVFFGCSMDDPYVKALLDAVASDLWEWRQPVHFVVLPLDESVVGSIDAQIDQFQRYGIQVVLFDNWDGTFSGLDQLLDEAFQACPPSPITLSKGDGGTGKSDTEATAAGKTATQHGTVAWSWLEDINRNTAPKLKDEN